MALTALDGTFVQVNDRLAEMLGYTAPELMRLGVRGVTHPDDIEPTSSSPAQMRAGEIDSYQREKRYLRKDGTVVWAAADRLARPRLRRHAYPRRLARPGHHRADARQTSLRGDVRAVGRADARLPTTTGGSST